MLVRYVGEAVVVRTVFLGDADQPVAAIGVAIKARTPSGTVMPGAVLADGGTGKFKAEFTLTEPGVWQAQGECSGPSPSITPLVYVTAVARPF